MKKEIKILKTGRIIAISLFAITVLFSACEKVIVYEIPEDESFIVLNSIFSNNDSMRINLSRSNSVLEYKNGGFIENATVELYENENFISNLHYLSEGFYTAAPYVIKAGAEYKIKVLIEGENEVLSVCKLPEAVPILKIDTIIQQKDQWGTKALNCIITLSDPAASSNYYGLKVYNKSIYNGSDWMPQTFITNDRIIELYDDGDLYPFVLDPNMDEIFANTIYFSDRIVDGKTFSFRITIESGHFQGTYYFILYSLTQDYYMYLMSHAQFNNAQGNPFSEPVQVYSNITNGKGIFGGFTSNVDSVVFDDDLPWYH